MWKDDVVARPTWRQTPNSRIRRLVGFSATLRLMISPDICTSVGSRRSNRERPARNQFVNSSRRRGRARALAESVRPDPGGGVGAVAVQRFDAPGTVQAADLLLQMPHKPCPARPRPATRADANRRISRISVGTRSRARLTRPQPHSSAEPRAGRRRPMRGQRAPCANAGIQRSEYRSRAPGAERRSSRRAEHFVETRSEARAQCPMQRHCKQAL